MGIMVSKNVEQRSELNRRITSDLRARAIDTAGSYDSDYDDNEVKSTKKTGKFSWIWIVLVILAVISLICIVFI